MKGPPTHWTTLKKLCYLKAARGSGPSWIWQLVTGTAPLTLLDAVAHPIKSLTQYGLCVQDGTPTPDAPVDIVCNNGAIKLRRPSGMPIAYQMVEWLKPTGSIPITGFKTKSTQEIETVFYREQRGASYLYASDSATSGTTNTTAYLTTGAGNWRWDGKSYSVSVSAGIKITSIQNNDGVWLNDTRAGWYTDPGDFVSTNDLRLSSGENTTVRIYSMTIREGETVTLDLVPVQRVTDSAYGFYDKVSGNFYTNADATFDAGDPIPDPVEIYTDGTDEVLTVSGINLCNPDYYQGDGWYVGANNTVTTANANGTLVMPCKPNTTYSWWHTAGIGGCRAFELPTDTVTKGQEATWAVGSPVYDDANVIKKYTTSASAKLLCVLFGRDATDAGRTIEAQLADFMLVEGDITTATAYEPYVTPQTVTEIPMLLSVDDVKDEAEFISGLLTHRIGIYVIKGSDDEGWAENSSYAGTFYADCLPSATLITSISLFTRYEGVLGSRSVASMNNGTAKCGSSSNRQRIFIRDVSCADVDALKAKLSGFYAAGEPCIVAFPLATETTEQTTAHSLHTTAGTNVVEVSAAVEGVTVSVEYAKQSA